MTIAKLNELFEKIKFIHKRLTQKQGTGASWDYTFADGETHAYRITNVKEPKEIELDVEHLFIRVWSVKDYLQKLAAQQGKNPEAIEKIVNSDFNLSICADVANVLKHGNLKYAPRSGHVCKLGSIEYELPEKNLKALKFGYHKVEITPDNPDAVILKMPIKNELGFVLGDAFDCIESAVSKWENILDSMA